MSRWLWALLAGVVLVAIAAVFWIDETSVLPRFCQTQRRSPPRLLLLRRKSRPRLRPHLRPRSRRRLQPHPLRSGSGARCRTAIRLAARSAPRKRPRLRPSLPRSLRLLLRSAGRTTPAAARARTGGAGSRGHICAQEPCAAGWDLGLFRGGLRAPLPAARRRLGLSAAGGQVRPGRDCRVPEADPSPFRHLPDRRRIPSGRRAQGKRRLRGLDQLHVPERDDRAPLRHRARLQRFRRSGARDNPEEMRAVRGRLSALCRHTWCYMGWAGHEGYVHSDYLKHHVSPTCS